jgi:DNA topoisomerase-2
MANQYKKLSQLEHVLQLPDTYIGSVETQQETRWIYDNDSGKMVHRSIQFNPGFYKIFDEIIVNARDALIRSQSSGYKGTPVKRIDVSTSMIDGHFTISVRNDGDGIPVEIHPEYKVYAPELIFGNLLTSSNYDKNEEKIVGGKNGYGAKLANIFSTKFQVNTRDIANGKKYEQVWTSNMTKCGKPSIKKDSSSKGYVEIAFCPDLSRFKGISTDGNDIIADMKDVLHTRVVELSALAGKDVTVSWNGVTLKVDTFEKFVKLFLKEDAEKSISYEKCGTRWEFAAVLSRNLFSDESGTPEDRHISFVNGINTRKGGKHVETVQRHVLNDVCEMAAKKKKLDLKPGQIKDSLTLFVNATIVNPSFDSQTKETLTTPASKFGSTVSVSVKFIESLVKAGILDEAQAILDAKNARDAKKTDGAKKKTIRGLPKLEDALWAGTAKSGECTLILTEGDSAATSAIAGLKVVGREKWGVFPLKGKILNVKDISRDKFNANDEITSIKKILGLEQGKVYKDVKDLRYGRVLIMSDQDVDGFHIRGLLMNLFHTEWPSLMKIGFLCTLLTPLLKATKGKQVLSFYNEAEFNAWAQKNGEAEVRRWNLKYYKGLGTSTPAEAREWFENLFDIKYEWDANTDKSMDLAFNKKLADNRKEWLGTYDVQKSLVVGPERRIPYSKFVHEELIHFSNSDNLRSLPHILDGLKPSQRKILFGCFKRNLRSEVKVAQLAGYVSEHAAYHHGEASLNQAITAMAQIFVGANNINLLNPIGQFGSRLLGGKDSASPRYIHTQLECIVDKLFKKEDLPILKHLSEDGSVIEPECYAPIVPLLAINGCVGIGTGFSTDIPPHNPEDIVKLIQQRLKGGTTTLRNNALDPWWIGFKGQVVRKGDKQWITKGVYNWDDKLKSVKITELPVGQWTKDYKVFLDTMAQAESSDMKTDDGKPILKGFDDLYNDLEVTFILYLDSDYYDDAQRKVEEFEKRFKLTTSWKTTNMCCFDSNMNIVKYDTIGDMLEDYYVERLNLYEKRKAHQVMTLKDTIEELDAKARFIRGIVEGTIKIMNQTDETVVKSLQDHKLPPRSDSQNPNSLDAYEYLLRMRIDRIKKSALIDAEKVLIDTKNELKALEGTTVNSIWNDELCEFISMWQKHRERVNEILNPGSGSKPLMASSKKKTLKIST